MKTLFVVVKGRENDAEREAQIRGLELTITGVSSNHTEVYCELPLRDKQKVIDWYAKDAGFAGQFENGSCLWYAERD